MQAYRRSFVIVALLFSFVGRLAAAPTINTQPSNATIIMGQSATFTVAATVNTGTLNYLWSASTDNGVTWNTLSNNAPSNNVMTATLSINEIGRAHV